MIKTFISYHHENDQEYRNHVSSLASRYGVFEDCSVELKDIDESLKAQTIWSKIRDEFLRNTQVTILLCGKKTHFRKYVDWEIRSSMIDGKVNKRSGILVIDLPTTSCTTFSVALPGEKERIYPGFEYWFNLKSREGYKEHFPELPETIIDNLLNPKAKISVVPWHKIEDHPENLKFLVEGTAKTRYTNEYDLTTPSRKYNRD